MQYDELTLARLQRFLLGMLVDIDRVCRENGICYWLDSGTALGAMRHGGFIPWDDDIDLGMPAQDYWKFLEVAPAALGQEYVVSHPGNNPSQAAQFAKVWKRGTVFQTQEMKEAGFEQGIFIDIFRYEDLCADEREARRQRDLCARWQRISYLYQSRHVHVPHGGVLGSIEKAAGMLGHVACRIMYSPERIAAEFDMAAALGHDDPGELMFSTPYSLNAVHRRDSLVPPMEREFEGMMFPCAADTNDYLCQKFGDWKKLPPPEARVNHAPSHLSFGSDSEGEHAAAGAGEHDLSEQDANHVLQAHDGDPSGDGSAKRIAVVTQGVKLADEVRGYTRFRKVAEVLVEAGFEVDLITSSFQHWEKAQRDTGCDAYRQLPYRVVFLSEPGYKRNLDLRRIRSHAVFANNLSRYFAREDVRYDLVYSEIPPNDMALASARAAKEWGVPYVADINDLWPEAMRMALNVPIVGDLAFRTFAKDAHDVYNLLDAAVGTSDEYALRPAADRLAPYGRVTVYVGNDLAAFDAGVSEHGDEIAKPEDEVWFAYAGTLGASYDIDTLIRAADCLKEDYPGVRVKILGDGPDRQRLEKLSEKLQAPVDFLGYQDYAHMAAWLAKSDVTVNSLVKKAPQSVVTKIGDYLASANPMINTGSSPEMRNLLEKNAFGVNVVAEDVAELAAAMEVLASAPAARERMGRAARAVAERDFDQRHSYQRIVKLVKSLTA